MIASTYHHEGTFCGVLQSALPPRSMVGQLTLDQHIGVRIPGGQPIRINILRFLILPKMPLS